jgi:hypothetical protein
MLWSKSLYAGGIPVLQPPILPFFEAPSPCSRLCKDSEQGDSGPSIRQPPGLISFNPA